MIMMKIPRKEKKYIVKIAFVSTLESSPPSNFHKSCVQGSPCLITRSEAPPGFSLRLVHTHDSCENRAEICTRMIMIYVIFLFYTALCYPKMRIVRKKMALTAENKLHLRLIHVTSEVWNNTPPSLLNNQTRL